MGIIVLASRAFQTKREKRKEKKKKKKNSSTLNGKRRMYAFISGSLFKRKETESYFHLSSISLRLLVRVRPSTGIFRHFNFLSSLQQHTWDPRNPDALITYNTHKTADRPVHQILLTCCSAFLATFIWSKFPMLPHHSRSREQLSQQHDRKRNSRLCWPKNECSSLSENVRWLTKRLSNQYRYA